MTIKEQIEYIVAAEVVYNKDEKRWATFEDIDEYWKSGTWTTLTIMGWLESARYKNGYYGTFESVLKTDVPEGKGTPFVVKGGKGDSIASVFDGILSPTMVK